MKRLLVAAVVALCVLGLHGCDKKSEGTPEEAQEAEGTEAEKENNSTADKVPKLKPKTRSRQVFMGGGNICLFKQQDLYCLGWGPTLPEPSPEKEALPLHKMELDFEPVGLGGREHICVIDAEGGLHCTGDEIDYYSTYDENLRRQGAMPDDLPPSRLVENGTHFLCVLGQDGLIRCIGRDANGFFEPEHGVEKRSFFTREPRVYPPPEGETWIDIASGGWDMCALTDKGRVYCWGQNRNGILGVGDMKPRQEPTPVDLGEHRIAVLDDGNARMCGVTVDGRLSCWGRSIVGSAGGVELDSCSSGRPCLKKPQIVPEIEGIVDVGVGAAHTCVLSESGDVSCFGHAREGQLGFGDNPKQAGPVQPSLPPVAELECNTSICCATTVTSDVYCWGTNIGISPDDGDRLLEPVLLTRLKEEREDE